jgi:N6-L-threonylcarbamoyladenine synthase
MKILGIETSCDETAVCVIECEGDVRENNGNEAFKIKILGDALHSQIDQHKEYGGVVPMMAKREHAKNLIPLFIKALHDAGLHKYRKERKKLKDTLLADLDDIFGLETDFKENFIELTETIEKPEEVEAIAVTEGPGLEPALWMGIIFAEALGRTYSIPVIPINHMEGHIVSVLPSLTEKAKIEFPAVSLLISGGHTELVLMKDWHLYEIIGQTRDDAVGEAFDKVARMLDLPYPGGPEISKLAETERNNPSEILYSLPRPMINSNDYDFSFSGLKTAVLYSLKNFEKNKIPKEKIAKEFEDSVMEVLINKTLKALQEYNAKSLIVGGGVISNKYIQKNFQEQLEKMPEVSLYIPQNNLRTDNAVMIAIAGYLKIIFGKNTKGKEERIKAKGHVRLG